MSEGLQLVEVGIGPADKELDEEASKSETPNFTLYADIELEPQKAWVIEGMLGCGELSCMFGPPGSGKSVLCGDISANLAAGREWFGRKIRGGSVLYVAIERASLVKRRLAAFRNYHGVENASLAVLSEQVDLRSNRDGAERIVDNAKRLEDLTEVPIELVAIDTVSRALAGGDENSPKDMGSLVNNLAHIQQRTGAHVMALHHIPADGTQRLRGHGALLGACDTTLKVERIGGCRAVTVDKVNDGPEGETESFDLQSVDLHFDEETGTVTTAPVVIPADKPASSYAEGPRLTANQQSMLNILDDAMPHGLTIDEWNQKARDNGIGVNRRATLMDLRKQLKDKRLVHEYADRWYVTN